MLGGCGVEESGASLHTGVVVGCGEVGWMGEAEEST
jgi:hypothetical protein